MKTKVYFDLSEEISEVLSDNNITIAQILEHEGISADVSYGIPPYQNEAGARTKNLIEIATVIAASSGLIISLSYAISKVISTLYRKPYFVSFYENEELRDANGNVIFHREGQPIFKLKKKHQLIVPEKELKKEKIEFSSGLKNGVVIKIESEDVINHKKAKK